MAVSTKQHVFILLALCLAISAPGFAGSITGTIVFEGTAPPMKPLNTSADPACVALHGDNPPKNEVLVLGEGQTMANVIVKVTKGAPEKEHSVPETPFELTQEGCQYAPHVFVVRAGQKIKIINPDGILHNVNCMPEKNTPFNKAMPKNVEVIEATFDQVEEPFPFKCNIHPWMEAHCEVLDHPYYDVTETDGKYAIDDLEPGEYEIQAWHEKLGYQTAVVTIAEDGTGAHDFVFSREKR